MIQQKKISKQCSFDMDRKRRAPCMCLNYTLKKRKAKNCEKTPQLK